MAWLLYTDLFGHPRPQVIFDGAGGKPFIGDGIRDRLWPGGSRGLSREEAGLSLDELMRRYPPGPRGGVGERVLVLAGAA